MNKCLRALGIGLLSSVACTALALPEDRDQPIHISADSALIDEGRGYTIYRGNVLITQGSLLIEGSTVELQRGQDGVERVTAKGNPAHFRQQVDIGENYSDAFGDVIVYEVEKELLTITENAKVVNAQDTFTGQRIVYDLQRSVVDAFGNDGQGDQPGRVKMVIQPKKKDTQ